MRSEATIGTAFPSGTVLSPRLKSKYSVPDRLLAAPFLLALPVVAGMAPAAFLWAPRDALNVDVRMAIPNVVPPQAEIDRWECGVGSGRDGAAAGPARVRGREGDP